MSNPRRTETVDRRLAGTYANEAGELLAQARAALESGGQRLAAVGIVTAAIRASDAICIAELGQRSRESDHRTAVELLGSIRTAKADAAHLRRILALKTTWMYGVEKIRTSQLSAAARSAQALVDAAIRVSRVA